MTRRSVCAIVPVAVLVAVVLSGVAYAYNQYNGGCVSCHGAFTDGTSPQGTTFPGNSKHTMHRSSQYMRTTCALCHRSDDSNNPFIGSSGYHLFQEASGCTRS